MDLDLQGIMSEAGLQTGGLVQRCMILNGELISTQKKLAQAEKELKELKESKPDNVKQLKHD